jgi:tetratricopeptide (TPR) repeat protein
MTRPALILLFCAAPALAAPRTPVVALLPPAASAELRPLALLIEARASQLIEASGGVNELHLKQGLRTALDEGLSTSRADAERLRSLLGADRTLHLTLETPGLLEWAIDEAGKPPVKGSLKVAGTWSDALDKGGLALAQALLGRAPKKVAVQPASASEPALQALGRCYATVLKQPLLVDTPSILEVSELEGAVNDCQKALGADPALHFATATLALAQAIVGSDADASRSLARLGDGTDSLEIATLARFWLLTRYQSNDAGIAFVKGVIKKHPTELIARAYLGETLLAINANAEAEVQWREYAALVPGSGFAQGRLSKALARQGKNEEAIAVARKAYAAPGSGLEARLEYASRLIDARQPAAAVEVLEPLGKAKAPHAEHLLRLGWAYWVQGNDEVASGYFQRALDAASSPGEFRTRGRALYDLALVQAKRGQTEAARLSLRASMQTGFKLRAVDPLLAEVSRELEHNDSVIDAGRAGVVTPRESALFPLDPSGEPDTRASKPPPPDGLVLFRF